MGYTVAELESKSLAAKPDIGEFMNCGYINREIAKALREDGITVAVIVGGIWQSRSKREEHCFIRVPRDETADSLGDVIIDGAIKQFNEKNRDDLWVTLGPEESLPDVAVLTESDEWFSYYLETQP